MALDLSQDRTEFGRRRDLYDTRGTGTYDWGVGQSQDITGTAKKISDQAIDTGSKYAGYSKRDQDMYERDVMPALKQKIDFAKDYTSPERVAANRAGAIAGNASAFGKARGNAEARLEAIGIDPSAGRYVGLDAALDAQQAKGGAAAGTKSDRDTEMLGQQYLADAVRAGQVLPGQAGNEAGISTLAGNAGANTLMAGATTGKALRDPSGWVPRGDAMQTASTETKIQEAKDALERQRLDQEAQLAWAKLAQSDSSGIGAGIGGAASLLKTGWDIYNSKRGGRIPEKQAMQTNYRSGGKVANYKQGGGILDESEDGFGFGGSGGGDGGTGNTPYDPAAYLWNSFDNDRETFDQGEQLGSDIGSVAGSVIGNIITPGFGGAWSEGFGRAGAAVGAAVQGHWDEAGSDLIEGTPLDMFFDEGGTVPDDEEFNPDEGMPTDPDYAMEDQEALTPEVSDQGMHSARVVPPEASPSGGEETDDVHAMVNEGEFIIPKDVTNWMGEKFFQKLIEKAYMEMAGPKTAEPEMGPPTAMALSPPSFQSMGA